MELKRIKLPFKLKKPVLAMGSQTKNRVCFAEGNLAYLSPLHPDLSDPKDFSNFEKAVKYFLKKRPKIIAYDLHPEYQSTKYALGLNPIRYPLSAIQHHHAHIVSCMVDNGLKNQEVIGVAFDGTGLGTDKRLWGAEFFVCDYRRFKRRAHFREIPLLGGERAIREPLRLALAWLYLVYKDKFLNLEIDFVKGLDKEKWQVLKNMYLSGFNSPLASSSGRLFDAVASLVLKKYRANSEAELAMALEKLAQRFKLHATAYPFQIIKKQKEYIVDPAPVFKEIILDLKHQGPKEKIAYCFHLTVAQMIRRTCVILRKETKTNNVFLSGGVFQNSLLLCLSLELLRQERFKVFTHKELSCNDSGISLGQAIITVFRS